MTDKPEDIYLREEDEVQFLLGRPPGWILRWGVGIVFAGVVIALWATWVIRYPDVVVAPVQIVTERPAVRLVSVSGGKIAALPAKDKYRVAPGEILAAMENPADWVHVIALERYLRELPPDTLPFDAWLAGFAYSGISPSWTMGALQGTFSEWIDVLYRLRSAPLDAGEHGRPDATEARLRETTLRLFNEVQAWKQNFLVMAPDSGVVSWAAAWAPGQYVQPGREIMTLLASQGDSLVKAQGFLPIAGAGKVLPGMQVRIHLAGFPSREYGALVGKVKDISLAPVSTGDMSPSYRIEIELPQGLRTDYGRELPLLHEAQGTARIITEKRNLLQRLFAPLINSWKNNL